MTSSLDFESLSPNDWIDVLDTNEKEIIEQSIKAGLSEEQIAELWLSRTGPDNNVGFGAGKIPSNYLINIKIEFRKVICGDKEYDNLRKEIIKEWKSHKILVISSISSVIAVKIGIAVAAMMPVVALLLAFVTKIGHNAWCKSENLSPVV